MEIKLVNENKLKIILTTEDMEALDITCEEMDSDDTGTRRILWDLLDKAKHLTGFDAASDKIFVKAYPDKTGGCLMYVTKGDVNNGSQTAQTYEKKYKSKLYTAAKKKRLIFYFENSETLLMACKHLNTFGYNGKNDIFSDDGGGGYYLYIEDNKEQSLERIGEYGVPINNPFFGFCLFEYTTKIIEDDAVKIFATYLCNKCD